MCSRRSLLPLQLSGRSRIEKIGWYTREVFGIFFPCLLLFLLCFGSLWLIKGRTLGYHFFLLLGFAVLGYVVYGAIAHNNQIPARYGVLFWPLRETLEYAGTGLVIIAFICLFIFMLTGAAFFLRIYGQPTSGENVEQIGVVRLHLTLISVLLAGYGVAAGCFALFLRRQVNQLDKDLRTLENTRNILGENVLASCEIAVHQLMPSPAYTQQLPTGLIHGLRIVERLLGPEQLGLTNTKDLIKSSESMANLRFAYSLFLFGINPEDVRVRQQIDEILKTPELELKPSILIGSLYRKGIYFRQIGKFDDARKCHAQISSGEIFTEERYRTWRIRGHIGQIITELARTPLWQIQKKGGEKAIVIQPIEYPYNISTQIEAIINELCKKDGGIDLEGLEKLDHHGKYYLLKAAARLKANRPELWQALLRIHNSLDTTVLRFVHDIKTHYSNIYEEHESVCKADAVKSSDKYCLLMLVNFDFCLKMLPLFHYVLNKNAREQANFGYQFEGIKIQPEELRRLVDELHSIMPDTYVPTIYSEIHERQIGLTEFLSDLREASGKRL